MKLWPPNLDPRWLQIPNTSVFINLNSVFLSSSSDQPSTFWVFPVHTLQLSCPLPRCALLLGGVPARSLTSSTEERWGWRPFLQGLDFLCMPKGKGGSVGGGALSHTNALLYYKDNLNCFKLQKIFFLNWSFSCQGSWRVAFIYKSVDW